MVQQMLGILRDRRFPQAFRLYFFILTMPPGAAITMSQMQDAIGAGRDAIANILVEIRKGRVRNPARSGEYLPIISIHYAHETKAYYDLGKATMENIEQQIPQSILRNRLSHARTRTSSIQNALGDRGLLGAISEGLIGGPEAEVLLTMLPIQQLQEVRDRVDAAIANRVQLESQLDSG